MLYIGEMIIVFLGIFLDILQIVFPLSPVLIKNKYQAEVYNEDQDGNGSLENQKRSADLKDSFPQAIFSFPIQKCTCTSNKSSLHDPRRG